MTNEVVHIGCATLIRGDSLQIAPTLSGAHALIADPPYGTNFQHTRRRRGKTPLKSLPHLQHHRPLWHEDMVGDEHPFDPAPWLQYPQVILWGAQHYASRLPDSAAWLIWDKRDGRAADHFASCELAWTNLRGTTRIFSHLWRGVCRAGEDNVRNGPKLHPAQKPIELMTWCVQQTTGLVLDPYAGSFTTGLACLRLGRPYLGIEIEARYFAVGVTRLTEAWQQLQRVAENAQGQGLPEGPGEESAAAGLSPQQRAILMALYARWVEQEGSAVRAAYGIPWGDGIYHPVRPALEAAYRCTRSRAEDASISRALRRLEARGLLQRRKRQAGPTGRTSAVMLLPAGIALAQRLTTEADDKLLTVMREW